MRLRHLVITSGRCGKYLADFRLETGSLLDVEIHESTGLGSLHVHQSEESIVDVVADADLDHVFPGEDLVVGFLALGLYAVSIKAALRNLQKDLVIYDAHGRLDVFHHQAVQVACALAHGGILHVCGSKVGDLAEHRCMQENQKTVGCQP